MTEHKKAKLILEEVKAKLILEDGTVYNGFSFGHPESTAGEVVFNTGMAGYPQSLTDPSYSGQILVFTYPLIGNYGVGDFSKDEHGLELNFESSKIQTKALIVSEYCSEHNHWNSDKSLSSWLKDNQIPAIFGIDTRALTIKIREKGVMLGKILIGDKNINLYDPNKENQVAAVSRKEPTVVGSGKHKIIVVDCGIKNNIIRSLLKRDTTLKIVPWNYDFNKHGFGGQAKCEEGKTHEEKEGYEDYDGIFISNGPGDPTYCRETVENIKKAMTKEKPTPIFGICMGNQLLALAAGAKTYKLKFGHRSQNQPCVIIEDYKTHGKIKRGYVTSQNHGFAVDNNTLPDDWEELFYNANDNTNEGIKHKLLPFFSVQFHPEGSCGPKDTNYLFDEFIEMIEKGKSLD